MGGYHDQQKCHLIVSFYLKKPLKNVLVIHNGFVVFTQFVFCNFIKLLLFIYLFKTFFPVIKRV